MTVYRLNLPLAPVLGIGNCYDMSACLFFNPNQLVSSQTIIFGGNEVINILILQTDGVECSN